MPRSPVVAFFRPVLVTMQRPNYRRKVSFASLSGDQVLSNAALTFAGVNGTERKRTPVASKTAFAIEDGTTGAAGSPTPHGFARGRSMSSISIRGTSGKVRIG